MTYVRGRISWLVKRSQTSATRGLFGLASFLFGVFMFFSTSVHSVGSEYRIMLHLTQGSSDIWGFMFVTHGTALIYGVITQEYNDFMLWIEGILGAGIWIVAAGAMTMAQGAPGAAIAGAVIALWICYRYPTHSERA